MATKADDHSTRVTARATTGSHGAGTDEVDRLLGSVLTYADESFNQILELGFATSIRKEWEWRVSHGESTANLEAFKGWLEVDTATDD